MPRNLGNEPERVSSSTRRWRRRENPKWVDNPATLYLYFGDCSRPTAHARPPPRNPANRRKASAAGERSSSNKILRQDSLRLTNSTKSGMGGAFYPKPIRFTNTTSFSTSFAINIVPLLGAASGMGMAFLFSPSPFLPGGQPNEYLGILNATRNGTASNRLLAVEFDNLAELEFKDPNDNHVGVDVNSLQSSAVTNTSYYSSDGKKLLNLTLKSSSTFVVWVDYSGSTKLLNVTMAPISVALSNGKPPRPIISYRVDAHDVVGNTTYVGFSASTDVITSHHYVFGWSFAVDGLADTLDYGSLPTLPKSKLKASEIRKLAISTSVAFGVLLVAVVVVGIWAYRKMMEDDAIEEWELDYGPHRFSYKELAHATKGFGVEELLGTGGFGEVYHGVLPGTKMEVAVKRVSHGSKQGLREFIAEVSSIGRLRHRNLVQLQGWCRRRGDLLLVYEYMPNGSLDRHLFKGTKPGLDWAQRFRILKGVASGLMYLHEEWEKVVLHRDIKSSNVLLDADMNGRLGDFGLSRLYDHDREPTTTRVVGTVGYLAPELSRTGKSTTRSDVFSFGAVILEVVSGCKPIEPSRKPEELVLVDWVWTCCTARRILDAVDPLIRKDCDPAEAELALKLGLLCSHTDPEARPNMRQVMQYLDGDADLPDITSDGPPVDYKARTMCFDDHVGSYRSSSTVKTNTNYSVVFPMALIDLFCRSGP